jgi:hypothetical protein
MNKRLRRSLEHDGVLRGSGELAPRTFTLGTELGRLVSFIPSREGEEVEKSLPLTEIKSIPQLFANVAGLF